MATNYSKAASFPATSEVVHEKKRFLASLREASQGEAIAEETFHAMLTHERRRAERSRKPFVLMLLDARREKAAEKLLQKARVTVASSTRETDLLGWYRKGTVLGVIFTELGSEETSAITETLRTKMAKALDKSLGPATLAKIEMSVHLFPENWDRDHSGWVADSKLYPDLKRQDVHKKIPLVLKRVMDVVGSGALLLLLSPILAVIAITIKLTSKGPILFEQDRLGQFGGRFKCLKFRTMYLDCDPKVHQDYVQKFIAGHAEGSGNDDAEPAIYKIVDDPRVTPIGRFLRRTSADEFPQFWNVLVGEMSLVGPRPPVPYEFEIYDIWHRRRVLELKPGVTGLWQVSGRSRIRFDDMVRLDLRYCQSWSLWLDLKILAATPKAVFSGDGAY